MGLSLGILSVHDGCSEPLERILRQRFGKDVSWHEVGRLEADCDDVALVQIAHIRRPALEVL